MQDPLRTEENANVIFGRLILGESLSKILKTDGLPSLATFFRWICDDEKVRENYARAREQQTEKYIDELVTLADTADEDNAQAVRLQVDTRKWVAGRMLPKKYGDKAAEVNNSVTVQNITVLPAEKLKQLQAWHRQALQG